MTRDDEAARHYEDPVNRAPAGPDRRRRQATRLSNHVPIRFRSDVVARIRTLAARDGQTVSSWVRSVVEREIERRLAITQTESGARDVRIQPPPEPTSTKNEKWESRFEKTLQRA
jgi:hypothetical protein